MKKIILFSMVLILIVCAAVPVLAAETYTYTYVGSPFLELNIDQFPSVGNYRYTLSLGGYTFYGISSVNSISENGPFIELLLPVVLSISGDGDVYFNYAFLWTSESDGFSVIVDVDSDDFAVVSGTVVLLLEKIESPGFIDSINSGLDCVMVWIQSLTSALISGSLSPILLILAVGIAVSALFLGAKYIYMICWGC